jgi:cytochrome c biogenesis protein
LGVVETPVGKTSEGFVTIVRTRLKQAWHFLTRLDVAAVLIVIVLLLAVLGSCFPQLSDSVATDAGRLVGWERGVQARYGALTDALAAMGIFRWFRSPVFLASLALLALATLVCTLDRWRAVWRRAFRSPAKPSGAIFDTAPHTARLVGPPAAGLPHMVRDRLEARGFRVWSESAEDAVYLRGERNRLASLATLATHLALLLLLLGAILSSGFGWRQELTIGPDEVAEVGYGTRWALRNDGFSIERHPDGSVAAYQAQVAVISEGQEMTRRSVRVNEPLIYNGTGFYLSGYEERAGRYHVTLLAVRDPGYSLVIVAGFLLLAGLTMSFNLPRSWIQARIESDGTLHLAGWAERQACDFGREFKAMAEDLVDW